MAVVKDKKHMSTSKFKIYRTVKNYEPSVSDRLHHVLPITTQMLLCSLYLSISKHYTRLSYAVTFLVHHTVNSSN